MYAVKLVFVLTLSVGYLLAFARADVFKAVQQINEALKSRPGREMSAESFIAAAEQLLQTETKGIHLFNGDTVSLLKKFIAVAKAVRDEDCSENFYQVFKSIPYKDANGSWQVALEFFKKQHDATCWKKLRDSYEQLFPTLDKEKVDRVSELSKIAIPIVREDELLSSKHLDYAGSVRYMVKFNMFLERVVRGGLNDFSLYLARYFAKVRKNFSVVDTYELYVTEPCKYYTDNISSIFEPQLHHYSDAVESEEFNFHFLGYQLCRLLEAEKSAILRETVRW